MSKRRCDACEFWVAAGHGLAGSEHADDAYGMCHRRSPAPYLTAFLVAASMTATQEDSTSVEDETAYWPVTIGADWCGDYNKGEQQNEQITDQGIL